MAQLPVFSFNFLTRANDRTSRDGVFLCCHGRLACPYHVRGRSPHSLEGKLPLWDSGIPNKGYPDAASNRTARDYFGNFAIASTSATIQSAVTTVTVRAR
jgi:hypothetical protein